MLATTITHFDLIPPIGTLVFAVWIVNVLVGKVGSLRGTTLIAPWCWAVAAVCAVAGIEAICVMFVMSGKAGTWHEPLKFAIATITFCPQMALLGAKRPQHMAWQFVVLTFWAILVLPALEVIVLLPGQPMDLHGLRSWFMVLLILMGVANSLPTRFWLSGLLVAVGQTLLLWQYLPGLVGGFGSAGVVLAMAAFLIAVGVAATSKPRRRMSDLPLDRVWIDFRDWFGALWGLRVVERVNTAAVMYKWPFQLTWQGFGTRGKTTGPIIPSDNVEVLETAMTNVLRRFVSAEWIAKRMGESVN